MDNELLSLLSPEQQQRAQSNALQQGLMQLGFGLLGASTGAPGQPKPRFGQILAQAGPEALRAYQQGFDQTLRQIMVGQQLAEARRKRQQEDEAARRQQAALGRLRSATQPITTEAALGMPGRVGPTVDRAAMIGQRPQMTREQVLQLGLDPDLPESLRKSLFDYAQATKPEEAKVAPGIVGEYQAAVAAGLVPPGTTLPQYAEMKKPPAPSATAIAGGGPDAFSTEVKKRQAQSFVEIQTSGQAARRASADINRLDNLLSKVETGGAAAFKQAAGNFGIKVEGLDDIQAAQAIINKLVPAQRPPGSGTMSDADLELYKQSLPRIINQPGANREIIRSMREINQYLIKEGEIAAEVTAGRITPEEGTKRMFALGNPIQDFFDRTQQQPTQPRGPIRTTPQDNSLILKYLRPGQ